MFCTYSEDSGRERGQGMRKTACNTDMSRKLAVDTKELQGLLSCGRDTAVKIGSQAQARFQVGKRVLWNVEKVQIYLDKISEG